VTRKSLQNNTSCPPHVYRITASLSGKVQSVQYSVDLETFQIQASSSPNAIVEMPKAHIVKASVLLLQSNSRNSAECLYYCGSYSEQKLLLSRISWISNTHPVPFAKFNILARYRSIRDSTEKSTTPFERWDSKIDTQIDWPSLFKYVHDPIIHNRTKELLYKIYTRACMVEVRVDQFGHSIMCQQCGMIEDEIHAFIDCDFVQPVWSWFKSITQNIYPNIPFPSFKDWHWLSGS
jgi:hypothetical protein